MALPSVQDIYRYLDKDPDRVPFNGNKRREALMQLATQEARQQRNNRRALDLLIDKAAPNQKTTPERSAKESGKPVEAKRKNRFDLDIIQEFDIDDLQWGQPSKNQGKKMQRPIKTMDLDVADLALPPFTSNDSPETYQEILEVQEMGLLREERRQDIKAQQTKEGILAEFKKYADEHHFITNWDFVRMVMEDVQTIVLSLKFAFNRPRPDTLAQHLGVILSVDGDGTFHTPAYPSYHSTVSRVVAEVIAGTYVGHKTELLRIADKIGMNRVIAGYHYMSDHQAGLLLANQLVLKITKNLSINPVYEREETIDSKTAEAVTENFMDTLEEVHRRGEAVTKEDEGDYEDSYMAAVRMAIGRHADETAFMTDVNKSKKYPHAFDDDLYFLNNYSPAKVGGWKWDKNTKEWESDGEIYPTVEHAYQASCFDGPKIRKEIREAKFAGVGGKGQPLGARGLAQKYQRQGVKTVVDKRPDKGEAPNSPVVQLMEKLVTEKFNNPALRKKLEATHATHKEIEEANSHGDDFWGTVGTGGKAGEGGKGQNHLGKILTKVRGSAPKEETLQDAWQSGLERQEPSLNLVSEAQRRREEEHSKEVRVDLGDIKYDEKSTNSPLLRELGNMHDAALVGAISAFSVSGDLKKELEGVGEGDTIFVTPHRDTDKYLGARNLGGKTGEEGKRTYGSWRIRVKGIRPLNEVSPEEDELNEGRHDYDDRVVSEAIKIDFEPIMTEHFGQSMDEFLQEWNINHPDNKFADPLGITEFGIHDENETGGRRFAQRRRKHLPQGHKDNPDDDYNWIGVRAHFGTLDRPTKLLDEDASRNVYTDSPNPLMAALTNFNSLSVKKGTLPADTVSKFHFSMDNFDDLIQDRRVSGDADRARYPHEIMEYGEEPFKRTPKGKLYADVEEALGDIAGIGHYQGPDENGNKVDYHNAPQKPGWDADRLEKLNVELIKAKLQANLRLHKAIQDYGGLNFIKSLSHLGARNRGTFRMHLTKPGWFAGSMWEGDGISSAMIRALGKAYHGIQPPQSQINRRLLNHGIRDPQGRGTPSLYSDAFVEEVLQNPLIHFNEASGNKHPQSTLDEFLSEDTPTSKSGLVNFTSESKYSYDSNDGKARNPLLSTIKSTYAAILAGDGSLRTTTTRPSKIWGNVKEGSKIPVIDPDDSTKRIYIEIIKRTPTHQVEGGAKGWSLGEGWHEDEFEKYNTPGEYNTFQFRVIKDANYHEAKKKVDASDEGRVIYNVLDALHPPQNKTISSTPISPEMEGDQYTNATPFTTLRDLSFTGEKDPDAPAFITSSPKFLGTTPEDTKAFMEKMGGTVSDEWRTSHAPKQHIFVFGSNELGIHGKGGAEDAAKMHGAIRGEGRGLTGNFAYALPTKKVPSWENMENSGPERRAQLENYVKEYNDKFYEAPNFKRLTVEDLIATNHKKQFTQEELQENVNEFVKFMEDNPEMVFHVTDLGTQNAGYNATEIADAFKTALGNSPARDNLQQRVVSGDIMFGEKLTPLVLGDQFPHNKEAFDSYPHWNAETETFDPSGGGRVTRPTLGPRDMEINTGFATGGDWRFTESATGNSSRAGNKQYVIGHSFPDDTGKGIKKWSGNPHVTRQSHDEATLLDKEHEDRYREAQAWMRENGKPNAGKYDAEGWETVTDPEELAKIKLKSRDYEQVRDVDAVLGVVETLVTGGNVPVSPDQSLSGSAYAVAMGIGRGIPVYVYNQRAGDGGGWLEWNYANEGWDEIVAPPFYQRIAGIGSREINDDASGSKAIRAWMDAAKEYADGADQEGEVASSAFPWAHPKVWNYLAPNEEGDGGNWVYADDPTRSPEEIKEHEDRLFKDMTPHIDTYSYPNIRQREGTAYTPEEVEEPEQPTVAPPRERPPAERGSREYVEPYRLSTPRERYDEGEDPKWERIHNEEDLLREYPELHEMYGSTNWVTVRDRIREIAADALSKWDDAPYLSGKLDLAPTRDEKDVKAQIIRMIDESGGPNLEDMTEDDFEEYLNRMSQGIAEQRATENRDHLKWLLDGFIDSSSYTPSSEEFGFPSELEVHNRIIEQESKRVAAKFAAQEASLSEEFPEDTPETENVDNYEQILAALDQQLQGKTKEDEEFSLLHQRKEAVAKNYAAYRESADGRAEVNSNWLDEAIKNDMKADWERFYDEGAGGEVWKHLASEFPGKRHPATETGYAPLVTYADFQKNRRPEKVKIYPPENLTPSDPLERGTSGGHPVRGGASIDEREGPMAVPQMGSGGTQRTEEEGSEFDPSELEVDVAAALNQIMPESATDIIVRGEELIPLGKVYEGEKQRNRNYNARDVLFDFYGLTGTGRGQAVSPGGKAEDARLSLFNRLLSAITDGEGINDYVDLIEWSEEASPDHQASSVQSTAEEKIYSMPEARGILDTVAAEKKEADAIKRARRVSTHKQTQAAWSLQEEEQTRFLREHLNEAQTKAFLELSEEDQTELKNSLFPAIVPVEGPREGPQRGERFKMTLPSGPNNDIFPEGLADKWMRYSTASRNTKMQPWFDLHSSAMTALSASQVKHFRKIMGLDESLGMKLAQAAPQDSEGNEKDSPNYKNDLYNAFQHDPEYAYLESFLKLNNGSNVLGAPKKGKERSYKEREWFYKSNIDFTKKTADRIKEDGLLNALSTTVTGTKNGKPYSFRKLPPSNLTNLMRLPNALNILIDDVASAFESFQKTGKGKPKYLNFEFRLPESGDTEYLQYNADGTPIPTSRNPAYNPDRVFHDTILHDLVRDGNTSNKRVHQYKTSPFLIQRLYALGRHKEAMYTLEQEGGEFSPEQKALQSQWESLTGVPHKFDPNSTNVDESGNNLSGFYPANSGLTSRNSQFLKEILTAHLGSPLPGEEAGGKVRGVQDIINRIYRAFPDVRDPHSPYNDPKLTPEEGIAKWEAEDELKRRSQFGIAGMLSSGGMFGDRLNPFSPAPEEGSDIIPQPVQGTLEGESGLGGKDQASLSLVPFYPETFDPSLSGDMIYERFKNHSKKFLDLIGLHNSAHTKVQRRVAMERLMANVEDHVQNIRQTNAERFEEMDDSGVAGEAPQDPRVIDAMNQSAMRNLTQLDDYYRNVLLQTRGSLGATDRTGEPLVDPETLEAAQDFRNNLKPLMSESPDTQTLRDALSVHVQQYKHVPYKAIGRSATELLGHNVGVDVESDQSQQLETDLKALAQFYIPQLRGLYHQLQHDLIGHTNIAPEILANLKEWQDIPTDYRLTTAGDTESLAQQMGAYREAYRSLSGIEQVELGTNIRAGRVRNPQAYLDPALPNSLLNFPETTVDDRRTRETQKEDEITVNLLRYGENSPEAVETALSNLEEKLKNPEDRAKALATFNMADRIQETLDLAAFYRDRQETSDKWGVIMSSVMVDEKTGELIDSPVKEYVDGHAIYASDWQSMFPSESAAVAAKARDRIGKFIGKLPVEQQRQIMSQMLTIMENGELPEFHPVQTNASDLKKDVALAITGGTLITPQPNEVSRVKGRSESGNKTWGMGEEAYERAQERQRGTALKYLSDLIFDPNNRYETQLDDVSYSIEDGAALEDLLSPEASLEDFDSVPSTFVQRYNLLNSMSVKDVGTGKVRNTTVVQEELKRRKELAESIISQHGVSQEQGFKDVYDEHVEDLMALLDGTLEAGDQRIGWWDIAATKYHPDRKELNDAGEEVTIPGEAITHNGQSEADGGIPLTQTYDEVATDHLDRVHANLQKKQKEEIMGSSGGVLVSPLDEGAIDVRGLGRSDAQDFQQRAEGDFDQDFQTGLAESQKQHRERNEAIARSNRGIPSEIEAAATKDEQ